LKGFAAHQDMVANFATLVIGINTKGIRLVLSQLLLERCSVAVIIKSLGSSSCYIGGSILIDSVVRVSTAAVSYVWRENSRATSIRGSRLIFCTHVIVI
jgi:hypothetical protein